MAEALVVVEDVVTAMGVDWYVVVLVGVALLELFVVEWLLDLVDAHLSDS